MILGKSETVQNAIRDTTHYSYLYGVAASRVAKQVIGSRIRRSWLENLDDESWNLVGIDEIESRITQDLFKARASVSEQGYCQIGMTAIVMGDVSAENTLKCVHRRHFLAVFALNERILLFKRTRLPAHEDDLRRGH